jgi:hypothetical protein
MLDLRRRQFITLLAGAVACPLAGRAQQPGKLPTIGFLGANNATFERTSTDAFVQRLRELGWIENRTVAIEYPWAEGRDGRFAEIAAEFIRLKVDVILTYATPSSVAAKKATAVIPIVFAAAGDPVGTGLVASLARPGGNITGLSIQQTDLASKRLEMLREVSGASSKACGFERKSASTLFEQPDYEQENHRPNDGVDDCRDAAADENKPGQWQEPTGQDGADNADDDVTHKSKTVALDE